MTSTDRTRTMNPRFHLTTIDDKGHDTRGRHWFIVDITTNQVIAKFIGRKGEHTAAGYARIAARALNEQEEGTATAQTPE